MIYYEHRLSLTPASDYDIVSLPRLIVKALRITWSIVFRLEVLAPVGERQRFRRQVLSPVIGPEVYAMQVKGQRISGSHYDRPGPGHHGWLARFAAAIAN